MLGLRIGKMFLLVEGLVVEFHRKDVEKWKEEPWTWIPSRSWGVLRWSLRTWQYSDSFGWYGTQYTIYIIICPYWGGYVEYGRVDARHGAFNNISWDIETALIANRDKSDATVADSEPSYLPLGVGLPLVCLAYEVIWTFLFELRRVAPPPPWNDIRDRWIWRFLCLNVAWTLRMRFIAGWLFVTSL